MHKHTPEKCTNGLRHRILNFKIYIPCTKLDRTNNVGSLNRAGTTWPCTKLDQMSTLHGLNNLTRQTFMLSHTSSSPLEGPAQKRMPKLCYTKKRPSTSTYAQVYMTVDLQTICYQWTPNETPWPRINQDSRPIQRCGHNHKKLPRASYNIWKHHQAYGRIHQSQTNSTLVT